MVFQSITSGCGMQMLEEGLRLLDYKATAYYTDQQATVSDDTLLKLVTRSRVNVLNVKNVHTLIRIVLYLWADCNSIEHNQPFSCL